LATFTFIAIVSFLPVVLIRIARWAFLPRIDRFIPQFVGAYLARVDDFKFTLAGDAPIVESIKVDLSA
jgi:hypothetical protein